MYNNKNVEVIRQAEDKLSRQVYTFRISPTNVHQFILESYEVQVRLTVRSKFVCSSGYVRLRSNGDIRRMFFKDVPLTQDIIDEAFTSFIQLFTFTEWNNPYESNNS